MIRNFIKKIVCKKDYFNKQNILSKTVYYLLIKIIWKPRLGIVKKIFNPVSLFLLIEPIS